MANTKRALNDLGKAITERLAACHFLLEDGRLPSQDEVDRYAFNLARVITMDPGGRSEEYLNHFLSGSGKTKNFDLNLLLRQDKGVNERLVNELYRRVHGVKTQREKHQDSLMTLTSSAQRSRKVITIFQHNFARRDWRYALGTFEFDWDIVAKTNDMITLKVWGQNVYQWHPKSGRVTEYLHNSGARLNNSGAAKNFTMRAKPALIHIPSKVDSLYKQTTFTQTNPRHQNFRVKEAAAVTALGLLVARDKLSKVAAEAVYEIL